MNVYAVAKKCMLQQRKAQKKQPTSATAGETATENVSCIWDEWDTIRLDFPFVSSFGEILKNVGKSLLYRISWRIR